MKVNIINKAGQRKSVNPNIWKSIQSWPNAGGWILDVEKPDELKEPENWDIPTSSVPNAVMQPEKAKKRLPRKKQVG